jgi:hypothetical protein
VVTGNVGATAAVTVLEPVDVVANVTFGAAACASGANARLTTAVIATAATLLARMEPPSLVGFFDIEPAQRR